MTRVFESICFICGSLEPGKDGVGDYTRRLAAAFVRQGLSVVAVAVNDRWLRLGTKLGPVVQVDGETDLNVYRMHRRGVDSAELRAIFQRHSITLASLQYVPTAFDARGLPFGLAGRLQQAATNIRWHIMCHELWMQDGWNDPKNHIVGILQRRILNRLLRRLRPVAIHTSIVFYRIKLQALGWTPIVRQIHGGFALEADPVWSLRSVLASKQAPAETIVVVIFGTIYPQFPGERFVAYLSRMAAKTGTGFTLCLMGKNGYPQGRDRLVRAIADIPGGIRLLEIGELSPTCVRRSFAEAAFGVCTTALEHGGKSSSAAAMIESGLWVVGYSSDQVPFELKPFPAGMIDLADGDPLTEQLQHRHVVEDILGGTVDSMRNALTIKP